MRDELTNKPTNAEAQVPEIKGKELAEKPTKPVPSVAARCSEVRDLAEAGYGHEDIVVMLGMHKTPANRDWVRRIVINREAS